MALNKVVPGPISVRPKVIPGKDGFWLPNWNWNSDQHLGFDKEYRSLIYRSFPCLGDKTDKHYWIYMGPSLAGAAAILLSLGKIRSGEIWVLWNGDEGALLSALGLLISGLFLSFDLDTVALFDRCPWAPSDDPATLATELNVFTLGPWSLINESSSTIFQHTAMQWGRGSWQKSLAWGEASESLKGLILKSHRQGQRLRPMTKRP